MITPTAKSKQKTLRRSARPRGSALANRIADALMTEPWMNRKAIRLQLRGPDEEDLGGNCRESVIRAIDAVLTPNAERSHGENGTKL